MIRGIGVDTVDIARFSRQLEKTQTLRERLFTAEEIKGSVGADNGVGDDGSDAEADQKERSMASLAARFAAKEALIKALGGSGSLGWHDLVVQNDAAGAPSFTPTAKLTDELERRRATHAHLSMTHDGGVATAFVVVEGAPDVVHDPRQEGER